MRRCFECGSADHLHNHHVVPRSLGGTKTIPLCPKCHGLVHSLDYSVHHMSAIKQRKKMERGEYIGGRAPYGWANLDGRLVPVPHELYITDLARYYRAQGLTLRAIAAELAEQGLLNRNGHPFGAQGVQSMVAT